MANNQAQKFGEIVRGSFQHAQARIADLEEEAQKVVHDLLRKKKAGARKEAAWSWRVRPQELLASDYVKDLSGRARTAGADVAARLEEFRERAVAAAGVASREQVDDLQRDLGRLSRKLDKLLDLNGAKKVARDHKSL